MGFEFLVLVLRVATFCGLAEIYLGNRDGLRPQKRNTRLYYYY